MFSNKATCYFAEVTLYFNQSCVILYPKPRVLLLKTTLGFTRNHVCFYLKPRLVLPETTCAFTRNHAWFYLKPRLILPETTPGFGFSIIKRCKMYMAMDVFCLLNLYWNLFGDNCCGRRRV